jgi:hypothetical protein
MQSGESYLAEVLAVLIVVDLGERFHVGSQGLQLDNELLKLKI